MNLILKRNPISNGCCFGTLTEETSGFSCYTLERPEVMIPPGQYNIEMTNSLDLTCDCGPNHTLSHLLPLLDGVPNRSAIRIHSGNWARDSMGCILVGLQVGQGMLCQSRAALDSLIPLIQQALDAHDAVSISIS